MRGILSIGAFMICGGTALTVLDVLTRRERDEHPADWFADGGPQVFRTPVSMSVRGEASAAALHRWAFWTPAWARGDPGARPLLVLYRGALLVAACGWIVGIATLAK